MTYTLVVAGSLVVMALLYYVREPLLAVEFGTRPALWPLVALFYGASLYFELRARKHLRTSVLMGYPELARDGGAGRLLTEGIYVEVRHPRYTAVWLGTVALALFTNYLAIYVIAVLVGPALHLVAVLEERELRERFGAEYASYCARVPRRFVPRLGEAAG